MTISLSPVYWSFACYSSFPGATLLLRNLTWLVYPGFKVPNTCPSFHYQKLASLARKSVGTQDCEDFYSNSKGCQKKLEIQGC